MTEITGTLYVMADKTSDRNIWKTRMIVE